MKILSYIYIILFKSSIIPYSNKLYNVQLTNQTKKNSHFHFDSNFAEVISRPFPNNYVHTDINYFTTDKLYMNITDNIYEKLNKNTIYNHSNTNKINLFSYSHHLLNIFPELKLFKWPKWTIHNGYKIKCKNDNDCLFPEACCHDPIIPGQKFCCTNWTKRKLEYAYQIQKIKSHFKL